jgi:RNA polymerase sigma-70 factor (ECF subfamily)
MDTVSTAAEFERHRVHLTGVAYRMLGTVADAEDAVQETYVRLAQADAGALRDVRGWLTTTLARICLDAVSMAMLVLLESLSPAERTAFVLREVLDLSYGDVSQIVGRTEAACRQLVARARAHVRQRAPRFTPDRAQHAGAVEAFLAACTHGDVRDLVRILDPDVVLRSDGGGRVAGVARRPVTGSHKVARLLFALASRRDFAVRRCSVNGSTGLIFESGGEVVGVMAFAVAGMLITEIDFVVNPEKLRRVADR